MEPAFTYRARPVSVYDGDTLTADVDLGMHVSVRIKIRLLGIDAPEMGSVEGRASRDYLRGLLTSSTPLTIRTFKDSGDKYGRWLALLYVDGGTCINDLMVSSGYARAYNGGTR